jgi:hypothetical protein
MARCGPVKRCSDPESGIAAFWNWFAGQADSLISKSPDDLFTAVSGKLDELYPCNHFSFDVGEPSDVPRVLVLSASGNAEKADLVDAIVAKAPELRGWRFATANEAPGLFADMSLDELGEECGIDAKEIRFRAEKQDGRVNVEFYHPQYEPESVKTFQIFTFFLLQRLLGDRAMDATLGTFEWFKLSDSPEVPDLDPIKELPPWFGFERYEASGDE